MKVPPSSHAENWRTLFFLCPARKSVSPTGTDPVRDGKPPDGARETGVAADRTRPHYYCYVSVTHVLSYSTDTFVSVRHVGVVPVSRVDRPQLGWKRPPEWDRFLEAVESEYGATEPYAGFVLERSWQEYREDHSAEEYVDRLLEAVARRGRDTREKTPTTRPARHDSDGRVWIAVSAEVKSDMAAYATEIGEPNHDVLRAVVCWYLDGGLLGLLTDKLEAAVPDAETQLAELDPSDGRGLTAEEKKRRWLADELTPGAFPREVFGEKLEAMPWRGGGTEHMRETHLQPVLNRIGYTEHPNNPDLFVPEEQAEEIAGEHGIDQDAPAFARKPYNDFTDDERAHGLRVELARRAARRDGKRALRVDTVRGEVFDGTPGTRKVKDLMDRAARAEGFETDAKGGAKRLRCDLEAVEDRDVWADSGLTADTAPGKAGELDGTPGVEADETSANDTETDATAEMDRIVAATPVTDDGGEE